MPEHTFPLPAGVTLTELLDDVLAQHGQRDLSARDDAGTAVLSGNLTQAELDALLPGVAARTAARRTAATGAQTERTTAATDLRDQYQQALDRLDQIAAFDATTSAAQVRNGVRDTAVILKRALRLLKAQVG